MGSGAWSASTFHDTAAAKSRAGIDTFDYSSRASSSGWRVHQTLDPQGLTTRESRDSAEHPTSNAIIISLDVTGSMGRVVRGIHRDLPHLHELLLGHKYIDHPQILFAAVGDATCDRVPLQVGQFESDNRMDQNLENMILEGGGGGQCTESYELMLYIAARHTVTDCWEKRKKKGYLFIIGDELAYPFVSREQVSRLLGGGLQQDVPTFQIFEEAKEKYNVFFILPGGASNARNGKITEYWQRHLGRDRVLLLDSPDDTSECIAMAIGMCEGVVSPDTAAKHLEQRGVMSRTIDRIMKAIGGFFLGNDNGSSTTGDGRRL